MHSDNFTTADYASSEANEARRRVDALKIQVDELQAVIRAAGICPSKKEVAKAKAAIARELAAKEKADAERREAEWEARATPIQRVMQQSMQDHQEAMRQLFSPRKGKA